MIYKALCIDRYEFSINELLPMTSQVRGMGPKLMSATVSKFSGLHQYVRRVNGGTRLESKFCTARQLKGQNFMVYDALGNTNVLLSPWTESLHTFFINILSNYSTV